MTRTRRQRRVVDGSSDRCPLSPIERGDRKITIVNGYTQFHWRGSAVLVDYVALRSVMRQVKAMFAGSRIAYPMIGAGLARGDWSIIASIIEEELAGEDHTLVEYQRP